MFFLRKIGSFLRGGATPGQLMMATLLGGALAFLPGFTQAPGLLVFEILLLLLLNANLFIAGLTLLIGRFLFYLLLPVSFWIGRILIDGPTASLFELLINGPVTAWFGFENYVTTGGFFLGLLYGFVVGRLVIGALRRFREKMAQLEENSEGYQRAIGKPWVRVLAFIFLGGVKGKQSWNELAQAKRGNPIRVVGVVIAVLTLFLITVAYHYLDATVLKVALLTGLEKVNGATVDVGKVELDISSNRLSISDLALADPADLERNTFEAQTIEADVSGLSLLRRKFAADHVEVSGAAIGKERLFPGVIVGKKRELEDVPTGDGKSLEEIVEEAKTWKQRLSQLKAWLDRLSEYRDLPGEDGESLSQRLRRQREAEGYAGLYANHRISGSPTLTITSITANGVRVEQMPGEQLDIKGKNLSTNPSLLEGVPELVVHAQSDLLFGKLIAGGLASGKGANSVSLYVRNLSIHQISESVPDDVDFPFNGGTLSLQGEGTLERTYLTLPIKVTIQDSEVTLPRIGTRRVSRLTLPVRIEGPLDNPKLKIDPDALRKALTSVGKSAVKDLINRKAGELFQDSGDEGESSGLEKAKSIFKGFLKKNDQ